MIKKTKASSDEIMRMGGEVVERPRFQIGDRVVNKLTGTQGKVIAIQIVNNYWKNPAREEFAYTYQFTLNTFGETTVYQSFLYDDYAMTPEQYQEYKAIEDKKKEERKKEYEEAVEEARKEAKKRGGRENNHK